ncbi:extracellular solute-binding protein [Paenibacillus sp. R14(2021)]|uniref:ABC transporter substrate-binding protein n=1 Tax=Paenibacillus sp. R14(2021) TaxID=2859228 RepID=UPI001C616733|nr:extracellular solute-binding protein [Paenibacillus sp. R14(2021)]
MRKRLIAFLVAAIMMSSLLYGCMLRSDGDASQQVLRIALPDKDSYQSSLGDYLSAAYPDMKVELIEMEPGFNPISIEQYEQKLKEEKPDLVLLGYSGKYAKLASDGMLSDLSLRMQASGLHEDDLYPGMIEKIKRDGGGTLFAIAPTFQAEVLYYNADLFRQYKVGLPQNGMTIKDVMKLASQFARAGSYKAGIAGYHLPLSSMPKDLLLDMSSREGIKAVDFRSGKVTVNTPSWRALITMVIELYRNGTYRMQNVQGVVKDGETWYGPEEVSEADLFAKGKAAMTIASYNSIQNAKFETGFVTPPVSSLDTSRSMNLGVYNYMAIPAGAANGDAAWTVIQFMLSDYMAKVSAGLEEAYAMPVQKSYMKYDHNPVLPKLYDLLPGVDQVYDSTGYDPKFMTLFYELQDREIKAAVKGEITADACIAAIQQEGQALLDAAKVKK